MVIRSKAMNMDRLRVKPMTAASSSSVRLRVRSSLRRISRVEPRRTRQATYTLVAMRAINARQATNPAGSIPAS